VWCACGAGHSRVGWPRRHGHSSPCAGCDGPLPALTHIAKYPKHTSILVVDFVSAMAAARSDPLAYVAPRSDPLSFVDLCGAAVPGHVVSYGRTGRPLLGSPTNYDRCSPIWRPRSSKSTGRQSAARTRKGSAPAQSVDRDAAAAHLHAAAAEPVSSATDERQQDAGAIGHLDVGALRQELAVLPALQRDLLATYVRLSAVSSAYSEPSGLAEAFAQAEAASYALAGFVGGLRGLLGLPPPPPSVTEPPTATAGPLQPPMWPGPPQPPPLFDERSYPAPSVASQAVQVSPDELAAEALTAVSCSMPSTTTESVPRSPSVASSKSAGVISVADTELMAAVAHVQAVAAELAREAATQGGEALPRLPTAEARSGHVCGQEEGGAGSPGPSAAAGGQDGSAPDVAAELRRLSEENRGLQLLVDVVLAERELAKREAMLMKAALIEAQLQRQAGGAGAAGEGRA
jgi:hypothetical protein